MFNDRRDFVGRHGVLAALRARLDEVASSGRGQILALRGRRQVGKSTLLEQFVGSVEVPYVFVSGVFQAPLTQHLDEATAAILESARPLPDADLLTGSRPTSWREWLGRVALAARTGPLVVVLDEFPWLAGADSTLEGSLQAQWDRTLAKLPVLLVLIGSDVAMMDRLGSHGRPLFGRLTPITVPALNPAEIAEALPTASPTEVFDTYLVTGGYPRLVTDMARRSQTATDFVVASLGDPYSPMVTTARLSLDAEFPDPRISYQVLSAIGANDTARPAFNELVTAISDPDERRQVSTYVTRALRTLTETKAMIERETPAWAAPTSKLRRYRITDPYLRFWFRYVERNVDRIARGRADLAVAAFERDWTTWRGHSIEPVVRESLLRLAVHDPGLAGVDVIAPWWTRSNSVEIDAVACTRAATALVGTIKWRDHKGVTDREIYELRRGSEQIPNTDEPVLAAISPTGAAPRTATVAYSAADLLLGWA